MGSTNNKKSDMALIYLMLTTSNDYQLNHIEVNRVEDDNAIEIYPVRDTLSSFELMNAIQSIFGGGIGMYVDYDHNREKCFYRVY